MISSIDQNKIPPFVKSDGQIVIRGTFEWDMREHSREHHGAALLSFGNPRPPGKRVKVSDVLTEVRR